MPRGGRFPRAAGLAVLAGVAAAAFVACTGGGARTAPTAADLATLDGARYLWREARCVDGRLPLAQLGFERELFTEVHGQRVQMLFETTLARDRCRSLLMWDAMYDPDIGYWDFWSPARMVIPYDAECGVEERGTHGGMLKLDGDTLEVIEYRSPWCRGFDAHFTYQRFAPRPPTEQDLLRRYVLQFNRRDVAGLGRLFAANATLLEPFSRTPNGTMKRHQGRRAVEAWFQQAFAGSAWSALRLRDLYQSADGETWVADWDYMDSELAAPVRGRNLFVMADGEIFLTEIQLTTTPTPRADMPQELVEGDARPDQPEPAEDGARPSQPESAAAGPDAAVTAHSR